MQIRKCPIFITCSSTPLTDHILARVSARISQEAIIDLGLLYHQLTYCVGKISKIKIELGTKLSNSVHLRIKWLML